ncbi:MAG TPA: DnaB-like helicase C-terminal domain-containing protein, partial [Bryobacteraceae bacterium]|nr:DnaB-like helicase C-terminal domain-containing protein [Bryobacteraceae bacterium]
PGILDPQPTNQGVPTPWTRLTAALCGLHAGDLFVVAGRTSMGKTAAALQIAVMAALARVPVAVCSLEMDAASLMKRILAVISGVHSQQMRAGTLSDDDRQRLRHAAALIDNAPLWIDDKLSRTLSGIEAGIRKLTATKGIAPRLIIVDYIQLMKGVGRQENRVQELAEISHGMKHLAVRTKATVILLSQLNRGCEQDNRRPQLSDIKECGSIEEDADVVLFTHRPDRMGSDAEFIVAKQRNGPIGMMSMVFHGATQRFEEVGGPMT